VKIRAKLPGVGTTIFTLMSRLAGERGAVNLGQGFPDFEPPDALLDRVAHHLRAGHNQYAPMAGVPGLLEQIGAKVRRLHGVKLDPHSEVTVSAGGTESIFCAIQSVVHAGEEVVLLEPCFDCYAPAVELAGGRAVRVPLVLPDFHIDFERLAAVLSPRTRLVIVNTPHNPSGALVSRGDWERLAALLEGTDALLLADEVYEHLVYDGLSHVSALSVPALRDRAFVVFSFGKLFNATGWKIGYCIAPPSMTAALRKVHQFVTFSVSTPLQHALADYLGSSPDFLATLPGFYQARRDRFIGLLTGSRFRLTPSPGTYFQLADYSAISSSGDVDFCRELIDRHGVAAIPLSPFCESPPDCRLLRFCFAKTDATLEAAAERLQAL
jgi:methionine aminotransferase